MASANDLTEMLAQASMQFVKVRPMLPMYLHLIVSALFPIYTGAHASLSRPSSAAKPEKKPKTKDDEEEEEEDQEDKVQEMEGLTNRDAIILPITAGIVLAGLYFLIKRYGADLINLIMGWYFSGVSVFSVTKLVNDGLNVLLTFVFPRYYAQNGHVWRIDDRQRVGVLQSPCGGSEEGQTIFAPMASILPDRCKPMIWELRRGCKQKYTVKAYVLAILDLSMNVTIVNVVATFFAVGTVIYVNTVSKPWFLTNLQGFAVSYSALQLLSPTTFATGSLVLAALFFYDIWAVFFTPLMVGVAKNLDQPIKLIFPRPDEPSATPGDPPIKNYGMLGLGDIVIPGIMLGLALRFDLYMFYLKKQKVRTALSTEHSSNQTQEEGLQKAPFVSPCGRWGDWFWTLRASSTAKVHFNWSFPKPYFIASIVGYVVGMMTTLGVMSVFNHAQPALLYLVPGVLISLWGTALFRRELKEMWHFTEAVTAEQLEDNATEDNKVESENKSEGEKPAKGLFERLWQEIWSGDEPKIQDFQSAKEPTVDASKRDRAETQGTASSQEDKQKDCDKDLIVHFSIRRYDGKRARSSPIDAGLSSELKSKGSNSPATSQSSEDAVVVSSSDLEDTQELDSGPRYRTRSTKAANT